MGLTVVVVPDPNLVVLSRDAAQTIPATAPPKIRAYTSQSWSPVFAAAGLDVVPEAEVAVSPELRLTTSPDNVLTFTLWAALRIEILPDVRSPLIAELSNERANVVLGASSILPALPRLMIAPAPSEVEIVLEEKIVLPLCTASPFTVTTDVSFEPLTTISPEARPSAAKAIIEHVATNATNRHIVSAL